MTHRFPIKELARQAGLSTATVDRALNNRANVSPQTKRRVAAATQELEAQESLLAAKGRRIFIDFVVEAPQRFNREIQTACEDVLSYLGPAVFRPRYFMKDNMGDNEVEALLNMIAKRGSHGVVLKARDVPNVQNLVSKLHDRNIPVVTLVTDITSPHRLTYAGLDNFRAGQTAAYLMAKVLKDQSGCVLTTQSQSDFTGEQERLRGFEDVITQKCPQIRLIKTSGGGGRSSDTLKTIEDFLPDARQLKGVYSMGGANQTILNLLDRFRIAPEIFIAHDLDEENLHHLKNETIDFVLFHNLKDDLHHAFNAIAAYHGLSTSKNTPQQSDIQIISLHNIPTYFRSKLG